MAETTPLPGPARAPETQNVAQPPSAVSAGGVPAPHDFSASLETFQGPLDLLLYLIKENEVEITAVPIARILEQYLRFLDQAAQWDLQLAGEFLVMAATLMEIKSRELLPEQAQAAEGEELIEDPRSELVRQLLAYRRLKEQAQALERLRAQWEYRRPRGCCADWPETSVAAAAEAQAAAAKEALCDVDLYSLFAAHEKLLKAVLAQAPANVKYEGESIEEKITRIEAVLKLLPFAHFADLLADPRDRGDIAATFVALLELVRRRAVRLIQQQDFGSIAVAVQPAGEPEALSQREAAAAEAAAADALRAKAAQDALAALEPGAKLPWLKKRGPARPKFTGLVRPEDIEELDAEENEIARRIDAILAAADAISERFEQSRDGRQREEQAPAAPPTPPDVPAQIAPPPPPA